MELYHGGTEIIDEPKIGVGRPNLDFGPGFYLTQLYSQAKSWSLKVAAERNAKPIINKYVLDFESAAEEFKIRIFPEYNKEWLEFVCNCREGSLIYKDFDMIQGGVADDRVVDTIRLYMNGFISIDDALGRLKYFKPNNQICILNQNVINKFLKFESYEIVE